MREKGGFSDLVCVKLQGAPLNLRKKVALKTAVEP
jgi:Fe2+ transport system protein FeoA